MTTNEIRSKAKFRTLAFIGSGNMTTSIVSGLISNGNYPANLIIASNPTEQKLLTLKQQLGINTTQSNTSACDSAEVIVLAVKPQIMESVCQDLVENANIRNKLVLSIAAGIETNRLSQMLNGHTNIIRAMPNTPSLIGLGMTGLFADSTIARVDRTFADLVMSQIGKTLWVNKESDINTVIASAGSSPAYFFLFAQAMQEETMRMGLTEKDARLLVEQAMLGSAQMIVNNPDLSLATLRSQVTSKGGTTHQAIESFQNAHLTKIISQAMRAAVNRAEQMAKYF